MLSFCITVKNRSRLEAQGRTLRLLPNCVESLAASAPPDVACELVIADWNSDDWPLGQWLPQAAGALPIQHVRLDKPFFSRGRGLNQAAQAASGEILMFIDADFLVGAEPIRRAMDVVSQGKAYFPVCYSFDDPQHRSGSWRHYGYGCCALSRSMFKAVGGWPEYYRWGKEDDDFHERVAARYDTVRENAAGLYHQWHPNGLFWKDQYAQRTNEEQQYFQRVQDAVESITRLVPPSTTFILVDEGQFGRDPIDGRVAIPFPERDGGYFGVPTDSQSAIEEIERLRRGGASSIVFTWIAFWWLEYFEEFRHHVESRYRCTYRDELLIQFDFVHLCEKTAHEFSSSLELRSQ